jgi:FkbM family methyltransferase
MKLRLGLGLTKKYGRLRRVVCESVGVARHSRPALNDLDRKLSRWLDFNNGFFIEAGANDGFTQSNTYYLEKMRKWSGLLIEPEPKLAEECRKNRNQPVIEAALVERALDGVQVELHTAGLMSTISGALGDAEATEAHVRMGLAVQELPASLIRLVPGRSLSRLLDEIGLAEGREIDFLSLDVEGAEPAALAGLDFTRHAPRYICVEARDEAAIAALLAPHYELVEVLTDVGTHRDLLYRRKLSA